MIDAPPAIESPAPPGRWVDGTFASAAGTRRYRLYVPGAYDAARKAPLVVMLHGCTQGPDDFARGSRFHLAAEADTALVVYPEQPQTANPAKCWNWFAAEHQERDRGEPALLAGITRDVVREYAVDQRRVFVAGISAGGAMALVMGATYPDLYAAVGAHSGVRFRAASTVMEGVAAMKDGRPGQGAALPAGAARPTILIHGAADNVVSVANLDAAAAQLRAAGAEVEIVKVDALGHAWSGGSPDGTFTDPKGPDASALMWRFFKAHPR